jgi:hypothetical protein
MILSLSPANKHSQLRQHSEIHSQMLSPYPYSNLHPVLLQKVAWFLEAIDGVIK